MATGLRKGAKLNYKLMNEQGISLDTKDNSDNNDDQVAEDTRKDSVFSPVKSKAQKSNASSAEDDGKHSLPEEVDSDDQEIEKLQRELETLEKDEAKLKKIKQKEELRQKVVRKRDEVKALRGYFYLIYCKVGSFVIQPYNLCCVIADFIFLSALYL
ncbi:uncharacterized protein LOC128554518 [Mercenaria mercenaria]|uniref:uncharacterized protein LOC128554518 n=1 Tax=Mercenaria mercenaria TaxID=6596 RepID=UPI00234E8152|nr:uncharacterized protein LOC128554518 [Mercenaria mercenaria]